MLLQFGTGYLRDLNIQRYMEFIFYLMASYLDGGKPFTAFLFMEENKMAHFLAVREHGFNKQTFDSTEWRTVELAHNSLY